jgi:hypothetical protein
MKPGQWQTVFIALASGLLAGFISNTAFAFPTYDRFGATGLDNNLSGISHQEAEKT